MAITFHKDNKIKFEFNPTNIYQGVPLNVVGASKDAPDCGISFNDSNAVFVAKCGNDITGTGTQSNPVQTISKAITLCVSTKNYIVILDSEEYSEDNVVLTSYVKGIYSANGQSASITFTNNPQLQHVDNFDIMVQPTKNGNISISGKNFHGVWWLTDGNLLTLYHTYTFYSQHSLYTFTYYFMVTNPKTSEVIKNLTTIGSFTVTQSVVFDSFILDVVPLPDGKFVCAILEGTEFNIYVKKYGNAQSNYTVEVPTKQIVYVSPVENEAKNIRLVLKNSSTILVLGTYIEAMTYKGRIVAMEMDYNCNITKSLTVLYTGTSIADYYFCLYPYYDTDTGYLYLMFGRWQEIEGGFYNYNPLFMIINYKNNTVIKTPTVLSANIYYVNAINSSDPLNPYDSLGIMYHAWNIVKLDNGNFYLQFMDGSNWYVYASTKFIIINPTGTILTSQTLTTTKSLKDVLNILKLKDGGISFFDTTSAYADTRLQTKRFYNDGSTYINTTNKIISAATYSSPLSILQYEDSAYLTILWRYNNKLYTAIVSGLLNDCVKMVDNITFYNLTIKNNTIDTQKRIFKGTGNLTLQYCTLQSKKQRPECAVNHTIGSIIGNVTIQHSVIFHSDEGLIATKVTDCFVEYSLFYFILYGYCLKLSSLAEANILVNHSVFFNTYGGINIDTALISGNIKNSIFHSDALYDINIVNNTGTIYLLNSIYTGLITGLESAIDCKLINPLFVNEGAYGVESVDLHLRTVYLGYPQNSPAFQLADDGSDSGAYIMNYIILPQQRDMIILPKPRIDITIEPVNPQIVSNKVGQVFTKRDGLQKIYTLTWNSLLLDDYKKLLKMISCKNNSIYFYPDAITNCDFINCKLIYTSLSASSQWPIQFETGYQNLVIKLGHEFEFVED